MVPFPIPWPPAFARDMALTIAVIAFALGSLARSFLGRGRIGVLPLIGALLGGSVGEDFVLPDLAPARGGHALADELLEGCGLLPFLVRFGMHLDFPPLGNLHLDGTNEVGVRGRFPAHDDRFARSNPVREGDHSIVDFIALVTRVG